MPLASLVIAIVSLCISVLTAWLTLLRRGRLPMTKPAMVFFGFDDVPRTTAKIFLRTLLYSTAARGQVVEGMFAKLKHNAANRCSVFGGMAKRASSSPEVGCTWGRRESR